MSKTLKEILKNEKCPLRKITKYNIYDVTGELAEYLHEEFVVQKDKRIAELEKKANEYKDYRFEMPYHNVTILAKTLENLDNLISSIQRKAINDYKKYQNNLAIEKLEELRDFMDEDWSDIYFHFKDIYSKINSMIKSLKGKSK